MQILDVWNQKKEKNNPKSNSQKQNLMNLNANNDA